MCTFPSCCSVEVVVTGITFNVVVVSFDLFASQFLQSNFSVLLTLDSVVVVVDGTDVVLEVVIEVVVAFSVVVVGTLSDVSRHLSWS